MPFTHLLQAFYKPPRPCCVAVVARLKRQLAQLCVWGGVALFTPLVSRPTPRAPPPAPPPSVIPLCLRHRLRKDPLADIDSGDKVREVFKSVFGME